MNPTLEPSPPLPALRHLGDWADVERQGYHSNVSPKAILASLLAFERRFDLPVVWTLTPATAAEQIESWASWFSRELVECANRLLPGMKSETTTP